MIKSVERSDSLTLVISHSSVLSCKPLLGATQILALWARILYALFLAVAAFLKNRLSIPSGRKKMSSIKTMPRIRVQYSV